MPALQKLDDSGWFQDSATAAVSKLDSVHNLRTYREHHLKAVSIGMPLPSLREYEGKTIDMICKRCDRAGSYERKLLAKKFGLSIEFAELRRILAVGCDRLGTDKCEASFPCPLSAGIKIENGSANV